MKKRVLILGNGASRISSSSFIENWSSEVWLCNHAYEEANYLKNVTLVGSVHPDECFEKAFFTKQKYNLKYNLITRQRYNSPFKNFSFQYDRGFSTGSLMLAEAFLRNYDEIYLCGFDFGGKDLYQSKDVIGSNFLKQFKIIISEFPKYKVKFVLNNKVLSIQDFFASKKEKIEEDDSYLSFLKSKIKDPVLLIGNGPSILKYELGKKIDSHFNTVIRLNDYKTKGFEKNIGEKTDLWFSGASHRTQVKSRPEMKNNTFVIVPKGSRKNAEKTLEDRIGLKKEEVYWMPQKVFSEISSIFLNNRPSTGSLSIQFLINYLNLNELYVHGFDFYEKNIGHYYKDSEEITPFLGINHDWELEKEKYQLLLENKKIIELKDFL